MKGQRQKRKRPVTPAEIQSVANDLRRQVATMEEVAGQMKREGMPRVDIDGANSGRTAVEFAKDFSLRIRRGLLQPA